MRDASEKLQRELKKMSSGGRSTWFDDKNPVTLRERLRKSEAGARDAGFEALVSHLLADCLADYNSRDTDAIGSILERIKADLGTEFDLPVEMRFGGSVSKNTFVNGLSDVDALVLLQPEGCSREVTCGVTLPFRGEAPSSLWERCCSRRPPLCHSHCLRARHSVAPRDGRWQPAKDIQSRW